MRCMAVRRPGLRTLKGQAKRFSLRNGRRAEGFSSSDLYRWEPRYFKQEILSEKHNSKRRRLKEAFNFDHHQVCQRTR